MSACSSNQVTPNAMVLRTFHLGLQVLRKETNDMIDLTQTVPNHNNDTHYLEKLKLMMGKFHHKKRKPHNGVYVWDSNELDDTSSLPLPEEAGLIHPFV
jgi:hypothetical protein